MKKHLMIITAGILTVGALIAGTSAAFAQNSTSNQQSLVQKIATRFSLNESEVQTVFDESRVERQAARQAEMQTALNTRLSTAVSEGKLTEAQKQLILAKHTEMHEQMENQQESMSSKTPEERRAAMEARRSELETWAQQNNIDISYVAGGRGGMMGSGRHGGMMGEGRFDD